MPVCGYCFRRLPLFEACTACRDGVVEPEGVRQARADGLWGPRRAAIEDDMPQWIDLDGLGYRGGGVMARRRKPAFEPGGAK